MDWKVFAWLRRGKRRLAVLKIFTESKQPLTINDIKDISKIAISQASLTVKELCDKNLIRCLNQDDKIGKLYVISTEGKDCIEYMKTGKKL